MEELRLALSKGAGAEDRLWSHNRGSLVGGKHGEERLEGGKVQDGGRELGAGSQVLPCLTFHWPLMQSPDPTFWNFSITHATHMKLSTNLGGGRKGKG